MDQISPDSPARLAVTAWAAIIANLLERVFGPSVCAASSIEKGSALPRNGGSDAPKRMRKWAGSDTVRRWKRTQFLRALLGLHHPIPLSRFAPGVAALWRALWGRADEDGGWEGGGSASSW